jgi:hypothetical protein
MHKVTQSGGGKGLRRPEHIQPVTVEALQKMGLQSSVRLGTEQKSHPAELQEHEAQRNHVPTKHAEERR